MHHRPLFPIAQGVGPGPRVDLAQVQSGGLQAAGEAARPGAVHSQQQDRAAWHRLCLGASALFEQALAQGVTQANYNLGVMFENGFGVPQDEAKAMELYRRAGLQGDTSASAAVVDSGPIYDSRLAPLDLDKANADDFVAAARNGDPVAMFLAGYVAASRASTASEVAEAARWFERAADRGVPAAMGNLGLLYVRGLGVPQDFVLGYMWLNVAAAAGLPEAGALRDSVGANMTPVEIADAQKLIDAQWAALRP